MLANEGGKFGKVTLLSEHLRSQGGFSHFAIKVWRDHIFEVTKVFIALIRRWRMMRALVAHLHGEPSVLPIAVAKSTSEVRFYLHHIKEVAVLDWLALRLVETK